MLEPMRRVKLLLLGVLALLALIVVMQNIVAVSVRFLAWEVTLSLALLLPLTLLLGFALGWLAARLRISR